MKASINASINASMNATTPEKEPDMDTKNGRFESHAAAAENYDTPELFVIGEASEVVLGVASGGFDGEFQMSEIGFEFELDGDQ
jgi:hypothetical protein